jgi:hypothetical protein
MQILTSTPTPTELSSPVRTPFDLVHRNPVAMLDLAT